MNKTKGKDLAGERRAKLFELGFKFNGSEFTFKAEGQPSPFFIHWTDVLCAMPKDWDEILERFEEYRKENSHA